MASIPVDDANSDSDSREGRSRSRDRVSSGSRTERDASSREYWRRVRSLSRESKQRQEARDRHARRLELEERRRREQILAERKKQRDTMTMRFLREPIRQQRLAQASEKAAFRKLKHDGESEVEDGLASGSEGGLNSSQSVPDLEEALRIVRGEDQALDARAHAFLSPSRRRRPVKEEDPLCDKYLRTHNRPPRSYSGTHRRAPAPPTRPFPPGSTDDVIRENQKPYPTRPPEELLARTRQLRGKGARDENDSLKLGTTKVLNDTFSVASGGRSAEMLLAEYRPPAESHIMVLPRPKLERRSSMPDLRDFRCVSSAVVYETIATLGRLGEARGLLVVPPGERAGSTTAQAAAGPPELPVDNLNGDKTQTSPQQWARKMNKFICEETQAVLQASPLLERLSPAVGQPVAPKGRRTQRKEWVSKHTSVKTLQKKILPKTVTDSSSQTEIIRPISAVHHRRNSIGSEGAESVYYDSLEEEDTRSIGHKSGHQAFYVPITAEAMATLTAAPTLPARLTARLEERRAVSRRGSKSEPLGVSSLALSGKRVQLIDEAKMAQAIASGVNINDLEASESVLDTNDIAAESDSDILDSPKVKNIRKSTITTCSSEQDTDTSQSDILQLSNEKSFPHSGSEDDPRNAADGHETPRTQADSQHLVDTYTSISSHSSLASSSEQLDVNIKEDDAVSNETELVVNAASSSEQVDVKMEEENLIGNETDQAELSTDVKNGEETADEDDESPDGELSDDNTANPQQNTSNDALGEDKNENVPDDSHQNEDIKIQVTDENGDDVNPNSEDEANLEKVDSEEIPVVNDAGDHGDTEVSDHYGTDTFHSETVADSIHEIVASGDAVAQSNVSVQESMDVVSVSDSIEEVSESLVSEVSEDDALQKGSSETQEDSSNSIQEQYEIIGFTSNGKEMLLESGFIDCDDPSLLPEPLSINCDEIAPTLIQTSRCGSTEDLEESAKQDPSSESLDEGNQEENDIPATETQETEEEKILDSPLGSPHIETNESDKDETHEDLEEAGKVEFTSESLNESTPEDINSSPVLEQEIENGESEVQENETEEVDNTKVNDDDVLNENDDNTCKESDVDDAENTENPMNRNESIENDVDNEELSDGTDSWDRVTVVRVSSGSASGSRNDTPDLDNEGTDTPQSATEEGTKDNTSFESLSGVPDLTADVIKGSSDNLLDEIFRSVSPCDGKSSPIDESSSGLSTIEEDDEHLECANEDEANPLLEDTVVEEQSSSQGAMINEDEQDEITITEDAQEGDVTENLDVTAEMPDANMNSDSEVRFAADAVEADDSLAESDKESIIEYEMQESRFEEANALTIDEEVNETIIESEVQEAIVDNEEEQEQENIEKEESLQMNEEENITDKEETDVEGELQELPIEERRDVNDEVECQSTIVEDDAQEILTEKLKDTFVDEESEITVAEAAAETLDEETQSIIDDEEVGVTITEDTEAENVDEEKEDILAEGEGESRQAEDELQDTPIEAQNITDEEEVGATIAEDEEASILLEGVDDAEDKSEMIVTEDAPLESVAEQMEDAVDKGEDEETAAEDESPETLIEEEMADTVAEEEMADTVVEEEMADTVAEEEMADTVVEEEMADTVAEEELEVTIAEDEAQDTIFDGDAEDIGIQEEEGATAAEDKVQQSFLEEEMVNTVNEEDLEASVVQETLSEEVKHSFGEEEVLVVEGDVQHMEEEAIDTFVEEELGEMIAENTIQGTLDEVADDTIVQEEEVTVTEEVEQMVLEEETVDTLTEDELAVTVAEESLMEEVDHTIAEETTVIEEEAQTTFVEENSNISAEMTERTDSLSGDPSEITVIEEVSTRLAEEVSVTLPLERLEESHDPASEVVSERTDFDPDKDVDEEAFIAPEATDNSAESDHDVEAAMSLPNDSDGAESLLMSDATLDITEPKSQAEYEELLSSAIETEIKAEYEELIGSDMELSFRDMVEEVESNIEEKVFVSDEKIARTFNSHLMKSSTPNGDINCPEDIEVRNVSEAWQSLDTSEEKQEETEIAQTVCDDAPEVSCRWASEQSASEAGSSGLRRQVGGSLDASSSSSDASPRERSVGEAGEAVVATNSPSSDSGVVEMVGKNAHSPSDASVEEVVAEDHSPRGLDAQDSSRSEESVRSAPPNRRTSKQAKERANRITSARRSSSGCGRASLDGREAGALRGWTTFTAPDDDEIGDSKPKRRHWEAPMDDDFQNLPPHADSDGASMSRHRLVQEYLESLQNHHLSKEGSPRCTVGSPPHSLNDLPTDNLSDFDTSDSGDMSYSERLLRVLESRRSRRHRPRSSNIDGDDTPTRYRPSTLSALDVFLATLSRYRGGQQSEGEPPHVPSSPPLQQDDEDNVTVQVKTGTRHHDVRVSSRRQVRLVVNVGNPVNSSDSGCVADTSQSERTTKRAGPVGGASPAGRRRPTRQTKGPPAQSRANAAADPEVDQLLSDVREYLNTKITRQNGAEEGKEQPLPEGIVVEGSNIEKCFTERPPGGGRVRLYPKHRSKQEERRLKAVPDAKQKERQRIQQSIHAINALLKQFS